MLNKKGIIMEYIDDETFRRIAKLDEVNLTYLIGSLEEIYKEIKFTDDENSNGDLIKTLIIDILDKLNEVSEIFYQISE